MAGCSEADYVESGLAWELAVEIERLIVEHDEKAEKQRKELEAQTARARGRGRR